MAPFLLTKPMPAGKFRGAAARAPIVDDRARALR
jgi:hypothetical protein